MLAEMDITTINEMNNMGTVFLIQIKRALALKTSKSGLLLASSVKNVRSDA